MGDLISELTAIVGEEGIVRGDLLRSRSTNWLRSSATEAIALVRPKSTQETAAVMTTCARRRQRVVVQGGMTGLVDGAHPDAGELALSLERMNRIESVDVTERTAVVQAGVTLQATQEAAAEQDLLFAADWAARGSATIGGAIATNGGGLNVIRYGMLREQVLGLEVVLSDGTTLSSMNRMLKNNTGYDLKQLFIGSEGTLGIITRAVLRLRPRSRSESTALLAARNMADVSRLLSLVDAELGGNLTAFEVMWRSFYELIVSTGKYPWILPAGLPLYVLVEARGADPDSDERRFQATLERAAAAELIIDAVVCTSLSQRDAVWAVREDIAGIATLLRPMIVYDVSLPIGAMETYLERVMQSTGDRFPGSRGVAFG